VVNDCICPSSSPPQQLRPEQSEGSERIPQGGHSTQWAYETKQEASIIMYSLQSRKSAKGIQFRIKLSPAKHEKIESNSPNRRTIINCPLKKKKKERRREEN